jgi:hypothetical protein
MIPHETYNGELYTYNESDIPRLTVAREKSSWESPCMVNMSPRIRPSKLFFGDMIVVAKPGTEDEQ